MHKLSHSRHTCYSTAGKRKMKTVQPACALARLSGSAQFSGRKFARIPALQARPSFLQKRHFPISTNDELHQASTTNKGKAKAQAMQCHEL
jgi:hypothetical protein